MVGVDHTVQLEVEVEGAYHGRVRRCMVRKIVVIGAKGLCLLLWAEWSLADCCVCLSPS